jgi:hypothetical protein
MVIRSEVVESYGDWMVAKKPGRRLGMKSENTASPKFSDSKQGSHAGDKATKA